MGIIGLAGNVFAVGDPDGAEHSKLRPYPFQVLPEITASWSSTTAVKPWMRDFCETPKATYQPQKRK